MIKNGNIVISQSMTKELGVFVVDDQIETASFCPYKIYRQYVEDNYPRTPSRAMLDGLYAETILLGSGARGEKTEDLPRKRNGEKGAQQKRIDIQMQRLYGYMFAHGVKISPYNTQVRLIAKYAPGVWLRGEMDIFPTYVDGVPAIVDVKTTKDITSNFASYREKWIRRTTSHCWGAFEMIAKNQPLFYHFLARNFSNTGLDNLIRFNPSQEEKYRQILASGADFDDVSFMFFVAGIGVQDIDMQLNHYEYKLTPHRETLLEALVSESVSRISYSVRNEFKPEGDVNICSGCALKDMCSGYVSK